MPRRTRVLHTFLSVVLLSAALLPAATAETSHPAATVPMELRNAELQVGITEETRLLSATDTVVTFEVTTPWQQLGFEPVTAGDKAYVRVSLPGWSVTTHPGAPALPFLAKTIGAPFGARVTLRVTPGPAHRVALPAALVPAATQKVELPPPPALDDVSVLPAHSFVVDEDAAVYAGKSAYPGGLAHIASDGVLRQQRVVGVAVYPVQYYPQSAELAIYEWLRVEVTFEGAPPALRRTAAAESTAYEGIFRQELLNYDSARQWRQPADRSTPVAAGMAATPWAPPSPGWRVKVRADGLYKLTYAELKTAGLPVNGNVLDLDPSTFRLYHMGREVAVFVEGEADGIFNDSDYILFYGQALASKYTADNVYWLTYGETTGLRMQTRDVTPGAGATPASYGAQLYLEQNKYYLSVAPGGDDLERWMWDYVYSPSRPNWTYTVTLAGPYVAPATMTVDMVGYVANHINPDHHTQVYVNGALLDDMRWDGITRYAPEINVPQGLFVTGNNVISVTCPNDTGLGYDVVYIDQVHLAFSNTFAAAGNELPFTYSSAGTWLYKLSGFTSNSVAVYDVTNPGVVARLTGVSVSASPSTASFQDSITTPTSYWAMASTTYRTVQAIEMDTPSNLQAPANAADHVVITHRDFAVQAQALTTYRASQMRATLVDVQDVYDEFGYGIVSAAAIHGFLAYASVYWQAPAPSFVVLVGDGHFDPKNYYGYGRASFIPPYLASVDPWIGETAADNRYVALSGDDTLPDMMLGRLSVNTTAEAGDFVNKITSYEEVTGDWRKQVLVVADNTDASGNFALITDNLLACCLPSSYHAEKVYYGVAPYLTTGLARTAIQAGINITGALIVNFTGHGYYTGWAEEDLLTATDVPLLTNSGKLPVVLAMTCREGYYIFPHLYGSGKEALGEVVTRAANRGAVVSWSPTGLGVASGHDDLNRGFFEALFYRGVSTVGQATAAGKLKLWQTGDNLDLLDTYLIFGDPGLRMGVTPTGAVSTVYVPHVMVNYATQP